ncbi:hypothetical protein ABID92_001480 [Frigoribacterium sp. PvP120]|uniref:SIR2 family protein n=1 Tax=unclassified Frigoribacterium TaxID=2627005 RepID=UPI001AE82F8F|nr:SIR2 family protein [Frigoribacterium sp. PvP121]MBP1239682.1 hypothetical protein [Frigoribacterium sp. PvP121]
MSAPDLSEETVSALRSAGLTAHTTVLLGAGASVTSGLPTWDQLAERVLVASGAVGSPEEAQLLLTRQDPLIVVEAARSALGSDWERKLRASLYEGVTAAEFSALHRATAAHAIESGPGGTTLATLNFDTLLEGALEAEVGAAALPATTSVAPDGHDGFVVHHLHGIVTPTSSEGVVVALTDVLELVEQESPWQLVFLRRVVERGAVIIAGTSYRDPDIRQWFHAALAEAPSHHAVFVILAREGFGVTKEEFRSLARSLSLQWTAIGIRPVLVHDYADAAQVVRELRYIDRDGYLSPADRAACVWRHHEHDFRALQNAYVAFLREDAEILQGVLDVETLNVSLWLSDADGTLARWASQDRHYDGASALRRADTGFDSMWIAGRALGSDELLVKDLPPDRLRRWSSVIALPIPVLHPHLPAMTSAVITVGLPDEARRYESSSYRWKGPLADIGDAWSTRLTDGLEWPSGAYTSDTTSEA